jgi:5-methylcytosine-specific restriction endonuclease McrA
MKNVLGQNLIKDIAGQRFGRFQVLSCAGKSRFGTYNWNCRCDCGTEKVVDGSSLRCGKTISCGCWMLDEKKQRYQRRRDQGLSRGTGFRMLVNDYKRGAKLRKHSWNLSEDLVAEITKATCVYCGRPPSLTYKSLTKGAAWLYNGIDRVDNARGYEPDNVVPCCKRCNLMKGRMTVAEFLQAVAAVTKFQRQPESPQRGWYPDPPIVPPVPGTKH